MDDGIRKRAISLGLVALGLLLLWHDPLVLTPAADWVERVLLAALLSGGVGALVHILGHEPDNRMLAFFAAPRHAWGLMLLGLSGLIIYRHAS